MSEVIFSGTNQTDKLNVAYLQNKAKRQLNEDDSGMEIPQKFYVLSSHIKSVQFICVIQTIQSQISHAYKPQN